MAEEFATWDESHEEIDSVGGLENVFHVYEEGMINIEQDILLKFDIFELLIIDNDIFSYAFHGKYLICILMLDQENFAKSALAHHF